MEVFKINHISTDYKNVRDAPSWEMWQRAEIVFMDKSHAGTPQLIYQLKDCHLPIENSLRFCKTYPAIFAKEGFILLGHMISFDRKKKQMLLENGNTVSYNHLVIVSGKRPFAHFENEELITALQALNDALKVKPKIPSSFACIVKNHKVDKQYQGLTDLHEELALGKVIQPNFFSSIPRAIPVELNSINNRLYEVQL